jgi:DNA polymerase III epsilon subunit-like protein
MKLLVFDTETSGLPEERGQSLYATHKWPFIMQLSYLFYDNSSNEVIELYDSLVKLDNNILLSEDSMAIHNITREMGNNSGKPIKEVLTSFINALMTADVIIGHNIQFDINIIRVECIRNNIKFNFNINKENKPIIHYCTMKKGKNITNIELTSINGTKYIKNPKLIELYKHYFNDEVNGLHNALADVLVCFRCYYKIEHDLDIYNLLKDNLEIQKVFALYLEETGT